MTQLSSQQFADAALQRWQELRGLDPESRIEILMAEFFRPPFNLDVRYEDVLKAISMEMADD